MLTVQKSIKMLNFLAAVCGVLEFQSASSLCLWKAGEAVVLVVLGSSQEVVSLSRCFEI
jgi:hypothetical protein